MGDSGQAWWWLGFFSVALLVLGAYRWHAAGTPWWLIGVVAATAAATATLIGWWVWKIWPRNDPDRLLRDKSQIPDMIGKKAAARGVGLRASIDSAKGLSMRELAVLIGKIGKTPIYSSWEDFTLVIMGPRSNKTSAVAVPRILSSIGAVVATSNKPDLWILTGALRARVGPVYAFDPDGKIAFIPQRWWWNILRDIETLNDARRMATHFVDSGRNGASAANEDPFFAPTGRNVLSWAMLAAAISGRSMRDVLDWIDYYSDEPITLLRQYGRERAAKAYAAVLDLPQETRGGVFGEAQTALVSIQDENTLRWVTPPHTWEEPPRTATVITELDLWTLYGFEDGKAPTLYLMTQEGAGSAGPVIAAMVARIFEIGDLVASAHGGRVEPPMTAVLDEAANICRIKNLPQLASHLGSKSINVTAIFQSRSQGISVYGADDWDALWGASTVRILGAGLQSMPILKEISELIGNYRPRERRTSYGPGGATTSNDPGSWEPIMPPDKIGKLEKTNAVLIRQGSSPLVIDLIPWYTQPEKDDIEAVRDKATAEVRNSAMDHLGPDNPVSKVLRRQLGDSTKTGAL